jgi:hypothetical protein
MTARRHAYAVRLDWTGAADGATRTYAGYSREHRLTIGDKPPVRACTRVVLRPHVVVDDDRLDLARELHHAARASCFIANAVKLPVDCEPVTERLSA